MGENITQYAAGKALVTLLHKEAGLAKNVVQKIVDQVAELLEEALGRCSSNVSKPQQQQEPAGLRDLQEADAVLPGVSLIIPRGKFDCGFFSGSLQFSNKQTSAVVPYASIRHVLVIDAIPKQPNTTYMVLVMKSGQPVKQGKNQLDLVVLQTKDKPELCLPAPEACQDLGPELTGAAAVVLSQLLATFLEDIQEDTFLTAESSVFSSSAGDLMVAANKGAQSGWLVPLSAGLCYVGKQGSFMPRSSISKVLFHRTGGGSSTFDITVKFAAASGLKPLELGQIDAAELPKLQAYCMNQRIKIGGADDDDDDDDAGQAAAGGAAVAAAAAAAGAGADESDDDEEDEDFDPDSEGGDEQPASKRRRLSSGAGGGESDDDDDDDEEDEDDDDGSDVSLVDSDEVLSDGDGDI